MKVHRIPSFGLIPISILTVALWTNLGPPGFGQTPAEERDQRLQKIEGQLRDLTKAVQDLTRTLPSKTNEVSSARTSEPLSTTNATSSRRDDPISRIREEGLARSQVMPTLAYLTEAIGPRLTGSPNLKRANEWTRDTMTAWGLSNAKLEPWGPFGRGWSLKRFSAQIVSPQSFPLVAYPKAWSPGFSDPITADVVHLDAKTEADLDKFKGKLKGCVVLVGTVRDVKPRYEPLAVRLVETNLLRMANAGDTSRPRPGAARGERSPNASAAATTGTRSNFLATASPNDTNRINRPASPPEQARTLSSARVLAFLSKEGARAVLTPSSGGDGGTVFIAQASMAREGPASGTRNTNPWSTNATATPAQIGLGVEDYNRLVRMGQHGEKLKIALECQVEFHGEDLMAYNTVAEIPGTDLTDEVVMLGAHLDSWHAGTGATDNGAGVAAVMEAMRIIKTLDLKPRRTIRVALWTGEEQGLLGSRAYVQQHFGYWTNATESSSTPTETRTETRNRTPRSLIRHPEYEKFNAYFNLDNGAGKIRGVYLQQNEAVRPIFRQWIEPWRDLGAETLTYSNTGGTDHIPFDGIGLPGFQFIQDPLEYWTRTHHSSADVLDRIQPDDLKQTAVILAAFAYNAAISDEPLPRKALDRLR